MGSGFTFEILNLKFQLVRLKQGLHPLVVEYFQGNGAKDLRVFLERCESRETMSLQEPREITEAELVHTSDEP